jgi:hypothetical protein
MAKMEIIFENKYGIYNLEVNNGFYLRIRLFWLLFWMICFQFVNCQLREKVRKWEDGKVSK